MVVAAVNSVGVDGGDVGVVKAEAGHRVSRKHLAAGAGALDRRSGALNGASNDVAGTSTNPVHSGRRTDSIACLRSCASTGADVSCAGWGGVHCNVWGRRGHY